MANASPVMILGTTKGDDGASKPVELPAKALVRHMVCLGSSGSGKTVAAKIIMEEAARSGVPVIALDPQGDIASLLLKPDREKVVAKGTAGEIYDAYWAAADVVIWTPGSSVGVALSVNPLKLDFNHDDNEDQLRAVSAVAETLANLIGYDSGKDDGAYVIAYLTKVFTWITERNQVLGNFTDLAEFLADPPDALAKQIVPLIPDREAGEVQRKLRILNVGAKKLLFQMGVPLDIDTLLGRDATKVEGKTRLSIIYLNSLTSQEEKEFFVAELVNRLYAWMLRNPSKEMQALFAIDEIAPYLPPVRKPACKDILKLLFKQARKYGIACLIASQNPGDVDYNALSQFSTWAIGKLVTKQDIKKIEGQIKSISPSAAERIVRRLPSLTPGQFMLLSPDNFADVVELQTRWLVHDHTTLDQDRVEELVTAEVRARFAAKSIAIEGGRPKSAQSGRNDPAGAGATVTASSPGDAADEEAEDAAEKTAEGAVILGDEEMAEGDGSPTKAKTRTEQVVEAINRTLATPARALTIAEIVQETGYGRSQVKATVEEMAGRGELDTSNAGRSAYYWRREHRFYPELGLTGPVSVARLVVLENQARQIALDNASKFLFFFTDEEITDDKFEYYPLLRVHFEGEITKGIFFKRKIHRTESLFLHPQEGDILVTSDKGGFKFIKSTEKDPFDIEDLDNRSDIEKRTPGELDFDQKRLRKYLSEGEVRRAMRRKFGIEIVSLEFFFLPVWTFWFKSKKSPGTRRFAIDGVTGRPFQGEVDGAH